MFLRFRPDTTTSDQGPSEEAAVTKQIDTTNPNSNTENEVEVVQDTNSMHTSLPPVVGTSGGYQNSHETSHAHAQYWHFHISKQHERHEKSTPRKIKASPRSSPVPQTYESFAPPPPPPPPMTLHPITENSGLNPPISGEFPPPPTAPQNPQDSYYATPPSHLFPPPHATEAEHQESANGEPTSEALFHWNAAGGGGPSDGSTAPTPSGAFLSPSAVTAAAAAAMGLSPTHLAYSLNHEPYTHHQV